MLTKLSFCQIKLTNNEYPKAIVQNGDTLCLLSMDNVDSINIKLIDLETCQKNETINEVLIDTLKNKNKDLSSIIEKKDYQLFLKNGIINDKDGIIEKKDNILKEKDKKIRRSNIRFGASTGLNVVLILTVAILIF